MKQTLSPLVLTGLLALSGCSLLESNSPANNENINPNDLISQQGTLLYSDDFSENLDQWVVEKTDVTQVSIINEKLDMDDSSSSL